MRFPKVADLVFPAFWRFRTPVQSDYDKLALRVACLLPEVELALREGKLGPHMRKIVIPRGVQVEHGRKAEQA